MFFSFPQILTACSVSSHKSGGGEQFLLLGCRAKVGGKGNCFDRHQYCTHVSHDNWKSDNALEKATEEMKIRWKMPPSHDILYYYYTIYYSILLLLCILTYIQYDVINYMLLKYGRAAQTLTASCARSIYYDII